MQHASLDPRGRCLLTPELQVLRQQAGILSGLRRAALAITS
jgi:hypothetical protein